MQALIEFLNRLGSASFGVAWPMLWQSSILILAVFLIEWALRRRVRAAARYALWLLVLVKLLLPPSLAVPTGLAWWLPRTAPAPVPDRAVLVTHGPAVPMVALPIAPAALATARRETLGLPGATVLMASAVSLAMLGWMLVRWRQAAAAVRRAVEAPVALAQAMEQELAVLGLSGRVRLRVLENAVSPAVYGLFRPVVLLPRVLVEQLSSSQLRAILVHELVHLRRCDVWVNCAQALIQVCYWWHPLVWLANGRIRRVREEAVDDAVVVALRDEAETYALTLLEVARLALRRPLVTLGLVGILESRSFLRRRIERLLLAKPQGNPGLTFASLLCVLAFGALAVPMAPRPLQPSAEFSAGAGEAEPLQAPASLPRGLLKETSRTSTNLPDALYTRVFKVDPNTFSSNLHNLLGLTESTDRKVSDAIILKFFATCGVDLTPPKSLYFKDREGTLLARGSLEDLDFIETAVQVLNVAPEQINIKATFLDLAEEAVDEFARTIGLTNSIAPGSVAMLTPSQTRSVREALKSHEKTALMNQVSVTTLSGRPAQVAVQELRTIVTNINPAALTPPGVTRKADGTSDLYLTTRLPTGPTLDLLAYEGADGHAVQIWSVAAATEFVGYDRPTNSVTVFVDGREDTGVLPLPHISARSMTNSIIVRDGGTALLGGPRTARFERRMRDFPLAQESPAEGQLFRSEAATRKNTRLLVLITPTIVDAAGNRVHPDDELEKAPPR